MFFFFFFTFFCLDTCCKDNCLLSMLLQLGMLRIEIQFVSTDAWFRIV